MLWKGRQPITISFPSTVMPTVSGGRVLLPSRIATKGGIEEFATKWKRLCCAWGEVYGKSGGVFKLRLRRSELEFNWQTSQLGVRH